MKLKKEDKSKKKEGAGCLLIAKQEICLGYENGFIANIIITTVATITQLPNLLLKNRMHSFFMVRFYSSKFRQFSGKVTSL